MKRCLFKTDADDPRPVRWPIPHPYWVTGYACDGTYATLVAYVDSLNQLLDQWPEAYDIDAVDVEGYTFTDRFPRPEWLSV